MQVYRGDQARREREEEKARDELELGREVDALLERPHHRVLRHLRRYPKMYVFAVLFVFSLPWIGWQVRYIDAIPHRSLLGALLYGDYGDCGD